jgi:alpha-L-arabinofuranosidase
MTWLQPPGYVHVGITETWAEQTVAATAPAGLPFAAQLKIDDPANRRLVLRAVNAANVSTTVDVELSGAKAKGGKLDVWVLSGSDLKQGNTAAEPKRISPKTSTGAAALAPGAASVSLHLPAFSFVIASLDLA